MSRLPSHVRRRFERVEAGWHIAGRFFLVSAILIFPIVAVFGINSYGWIRGFGVAVGCSAAWFVSGLLMMWLQSRAKFHLRQDDWAIAKSSMSAAEYLRAEEARLSALKKK